MTIQRASARTGHEPRRVGDLRRLAIPLIGAAVLGTAIPSLAAEPGASSPTGAAPTPKAMAAAFTGEFVNGIPVYRLPSISISANRKAELAKIEREDHSARAKQAKARAAGRPPA
jgi:hypothetical protein